MKNLSVAVLEIAPLIAGDSLNALIENTDNSEDYEAIFGCSNYSSLINKHSYSYCRKTHE